MYQLSVIDYQLRDAQEIISDIFHLGLGQIKNNPHPHILFIKYSRNPVPVFFGQHWKKYSIFWQIVQRIKVQKSLFLADLGEPILERIFLDFIISVENWYFVQDFSSRFFFDIFCWFLRFLADFWQFSLQRHLSELPVSFCSAFSLWIWISS